MLSCSRITESVPRLLSWIFITILRRKLWIRRRKLVAASSLVHASTQTPWKGVFLEESLAEGEESTASCASTILAPEDFGCEADWLRYLARKDPGGRSFFEEKASEVEAKEEAKGEAKKKRKKKGKKK